MAKKQFKVADLRKALEKYRDDDIVYELCNEPHNEAVKVIGLIDYHGHPCIVLDNTVYYL